MDKLNLIDFDKYLITKGGKMFSFSFNYFGWEIHGCPDKNGYLSVYLRCKDGKNRSFLFHRVIWYFFNGCIPKGYEINHKDEKKYNNSLENLELLSRADNVRYGTRTERAAKTNSTILKGRIINDEWRQKLSEAHKGKHLSAETKKKISEAKKVNGKQHKGYSYVPL